MMTLPKDERACRTYHRDAIFAISPIIYTYLLSCILQYFNFILKYLPTRFIVHHLGLASCLYKVPIFIILTVNSLPGKAVFPFTHLPRNVCLYIDHHHTYNKFQAVTT